MHGFWHQASTLASWHGRQLLLQFLGLLLGQSMVFLILQEVLLRRPLASRISSINHLPRMLEKPLLPEQRESQERRVELRNTFEA